MAENEKKEPGDLGNLKARLGLKNQESQAAGFSTNFGSQQESSGRSGSSSTDTDPFFSEPRSPHGIEEPPLPGDGNLAPHTSLHKRKPWLLAAAVGICALVFVLGSALGVMWEARAKHSETKVQLQKLSGILKTQKTEISEKLRAVLGSKLDIKNGEIAKKTLKSLQEEELKGLEKASQECTEAFKNLSVVSPPPGVVHALHSYCYRVTSLRNQVETTIADTQDSLNDLQAGIKTLNFWLNESKKVYVLLEQGGANGLPFARIAQHVEDACPKDTKNCRKASFLLDIGGQEYVKPIAIADHSLVQIAPTELALALGTQSPAYFARERYKNNLMYLDRTLNALTTTQDVLIRMIQEQIDAGDETKK